MPWYFNFSHRKARRAIIAEADARGVEVQDLRSILSVKELAEIIDNAKPHLDLALWGLAPRASLDDRPSTGVPAVEAAVSAAVVGDWQPAAELLVESYGDWDLRACAVQALAKAAANDDGWLVAWRTARPDDGHAAVVDCAARTALAWQLRGGKRVRETTAKQFDDFNRVLTDAEAAAEQATLAMPDDPTPWATLVTIARGRSYDHAEFDRVWQGLVERAPLHRRGHQSALQYWCAKWSGSDERMFEFAEQAAKRSPSLNVLVLQAAREMMPDAPRVWRQPNVRDALDVLLRWLTTDGADSVDVRDDLGWAAMALVENNRGVEAVKLFQRLGSYAGGAPWRDFASPAMKFNDCRVRACKLARRVRRRKLAMGRMNARAVRFAARMGAGAIVELAPKLLKEADKSTGAARGWVQILSHVCTEQIKAERFDVAAALARALVDICRPRGAEFELDLAEALRRLGYSQHPLDQPALDVARESVEIYERHLAGKEGLLYPSYASALSLMARELSRAGQHDAAVDAARRSADIERRIAGVNLPAALTCLHGVLTEAGRDDELPPLVEEINRRMDSGQPGW